MSRRPPQPGCSATHTITVLAGEATAATENCYTFPNLQPQLAHTHLPLVYTYT